MTEENPSKSQWLFLAVFAVLFFSLCAFSGDIDDPRQQMRPAPMAQQ